MTNHSHQKAFFLLFVSKDRTLSPAEQSLLDKHLMICDSCSAQVEIHRVMQKTLRPTPRSTVYSKQQLNSVVPGLLKAVEKRRMVQKTTNLVLATIKLGAAVLIIGTLLWALNQALPRLSSGRIQGETTVPPTNAEIPRLVVPSTVPRLEATATDVPRLEATATEMVIEPRTEVITYTVKQNDTIFGIAAKFQLNPETIIWGNYETFSIDLPMILLQPGMELNILPVDGVYYEWQEGDGLYAVALQFGVEPEDIIDWPGNHLNRETLGDLSNPNIEPGTMLVVPGGKREFSTWDAPRYPE
jgi:LysM repeat protein